MLTLEELLIETDPDLPMVATMSVGFDDNGCLMLKYKFENWDVPSEPPHIDMKCAIVEKQEAYALARKLDVSLIRLPAYISKKFSVQPFCQGDPSEARVLFREILDFFVFHGVRYQLKGKR